MEYLRKDWKERGLDPGKDAILVAGDFNCSLRNPDFVGEKTIRELLAEKWVSAAASIPWPQAATVRPDPDGKYPASDFDHILLSPAWAKAEGRGRWQAGVMQDLAVPSDHWPVWLRFGD
ncbi:MAG: endonuclease/exonuclease/phosphatase family protein [Verrucomicrobia bacterium]|nr:endonuclease/exonuclease/phosphatase family protein [Verrucomicrobiota bacterium]